VSAILARFVPPQTPWAHVGTDVTGFGVRFALELILGQKVLDALEPRA
jgi:hypothetical protein